MQLPGRALQLQLFVVDGGILLLGTIRNCRIPYQRFPQCRDASGSGRAITEIVILA
jgi:hypothetical protein